MSLIDDFLRSMHMRKGSDLHVVAGDPPRMRVHGDLITLDNNRLDPEELKAELFGIMSEASLHQFDVHDSADFAHSIADLARFRVNVFRHLNGIGAVFRGIPSKALTLEELKMPKALHELATATRGLILVTGKTGSGKSTTLAGVIDAINSKVKGHILTIEDPIEFVHQHKGCLVNQREVHQDTQGFALALRAALREDPDIVLIGELRDLETIESALRIAETGHLTFATLHTNSAAQTINRIIDVFPAHQQGQIRTQLSLVLEGIVCQALLPRADGEGRVVALEIMVPNPAIRNLIRDDKVHQIYSAMQSGQEKLGMQTMNQSLATLYQKRLVTLDTAIGASSLKDELEQMIARGAGVVAGAGMQRPGAGLRAQGR
jgi:twitching motility protein PilT